MSPVLDPRPVAFVSLPQRAVFPSFEEGAVTGAFREQEGLTVTVEASAAERAGARIVSRGHR
jgi:hypothetical protein